MAVPVDSAAPIPPAKALQAIPPAPRRGGFGGHGHGGHGEEYNHATPHLPPGQLAADRRSRRGSSSTRPRASRTGTKAPTTTSRAPRWTPWRRRRTSWTGCAWTRCSTSSTTDLFEPFQIPPQFVDFVKQSWDRDEVTIYGRFDLCFDGRRTPKLLEYNADTPTSLLEAAVVQWFWFKDVFAEPGPARPRPSISSTRSTRS